MILMWICCSLSAQIVISQVSVEHVSGCDPLANNGSIEIIQIGGESINNCTFKWEKTDFGLIEEGLRLTKISNLDTGHYVVTITSNSSSGIYDFTITAPDVIKISESDVEWQDVLCKGELTGKIAAQVTDNSASATYILLNEDKTVNNNVTGAGSGIFTGLPANTYHLAVKNNASCSDTVTVIISEPKEHLTLSVIQSDLVSCAYGNDGDLTVTINGGTGNYTLFILDTNQEITNTIDNLSAGTHVFGDLKVDNHTTVSIRDAHYCVTSTVVDVREMLKPEMLEPIIEEIRCYNDKGIIYIRAEAYNEGNSVNVIKAYWIKGENFQETEPSPNNKYEFLNGGVFYLYAQDSYGCIGVKEIFLSEPKSPVELKQKNKVQPHGNVKGSITLTASGGWEDYTIECQKAELDYQTLIERLTFKPAGDYTFGNLNAGVYLFTIEDKAGCSGQHHFIHLDNPTGEIDPETAGLKIFPNPSGDGKFIIEWNNNENLKVTLELYNIKGQLVYKSIVQTGTRTTLDISNQNRGTYLLRVPELNMNQMLVIY